MDKEFQSQVMYKLGEISSDIKSVNLRMEETREHIKVQGTTIGQLKAYQDNQKGQVTAWSIIWGSISAIAIVAFESIFIKK